METITGDDLLATFHDLGINTGNVSKLTIDAWCDTDCEATKEMLHWMCRNLSKENVLTAVENEEYEQSLERKSLLDEKQYKNALLQTQIDFPGILDYEKNALDVEFMEDELDMLTGEAEHLEQLLNINGGVSKMLSNEIKKASEEEIMSTVKKDAAQEKCMALSYKLDDANEKLQQQIGRYAEHLNEFEHATRPSFISNIPSFKYDEFYSDITSYLGLLIRREYEVLPKLEITVRTARKKLQDSNCVNGGAVDQLEVLRQRIYKSMRSYFYKLSKEEQLRAELMFLEGLNLSELVSSASPDDGFQFMIEANIFSKEKLLERVFLDMENAVLQICNGLVDTPKINCIEHAMNVNEKKLESLKQLDNKATDILVNHLLLYLLLEKEKADVQSTDKFFRDVHSYITQNLQSCQIRTESMLEVINEHKIYKNLPIEQKFKIFNIIKVLLGNKKTDVDVIDAIRCFNNEYNKMEQQVFTGDYMEHRRFTQEIENEVGVMRQFLLSGPTNQIIAIPHKLIEAFEKINELQGTQDGSLKSAIQVLNEAEKTLSIKKWFRVRRQLWMWFLLEPKRVLSAIEQVEAAVKQNRKESV